MNNALLPTPENLTLPEIMARFPDEAKAVEYLESIRWSNGVTCPHCGNNDQDKFWKLAANPDKKVRVGLRQCAACKKQFRVTVGTIFEDSHIPLNLWLVAWYITLGAKKGISALQMQRHLGLGSYRSAWHMMHRIRHALTDPVFADKLSGVVEADETYVGGKTKGKGRHYMGNKTPVVALVERGGRVRSQVMKRVTAKNLRAAINEHTMPKTTLVTDAASAYVASTKRSRKHYTVNHSAGEYARKEANGFVAHSNTVESCFSLLKRGVMGSFHHISKKHLPRYLAEFDFRWNYRKVNDGERTVAGLRKIEGKRLTYRNPTSQG